MNSHVTVNAWSTARAITGPVIAIPSILLHKLKNAQAAVMLHQGMYLSSLFPDRDGWFSLSQTGEAKLNADNIFERLGSWEDLGCGGPDRQQSIRALLEKEGLLQTKAGGLPRRLFYRFCPYAYLRFIGSNPESGIPDSSKRLCSSQSGNTQNLAQENPAASKIDTKILLRDTTNHQPHKDVTQGGECPNSGRSTVPDFVITQVKQIAAADGWRPSKVNLVFNLMASLQTIDSKRALTAQDWNKLLNGLVNSRDPVAWLQKVASTGWDPNTLNKVAKPGESTKHAIERLTEERENPPSTVAPDNQRKRTIVSMLKTAKDKLKDHQNVCWWHGFEDLINELETIDPTYPLLKEVQQIFP